MKHSSWFCRLAVALLVAALAAASHAELPAAASERNSDSVAERIRQNLAQSRPDLAVASVQPSDVPGLYVVKFEQGPTVYATADAKHFVLGDLFRIEPAGLVNLAERQRDQGRAELIAQVPREQTIAFSPKGKPRAVVHIFTDVECPWCRRQHEEVPALNAMGIEVRYLAYPRAGVGSPSYRKMVSAWCAKDPREALTSLKQQQSIAENSCEGNPVAAQYELASRLGVNGTPALVTEDGKLVPGYMPADQLAQAIGLQQAD